MLKASNDYSTIIQTVLSQTIGRGKEMSVDEAANLSGLSPSRIYQLANGNQRVGANGSIPIALLKIPAFAQRFGAVLGYDVEPTNPEDGCPYQTLGDLARANGEVGEFWHDGAIDCQEQHKLRTRILPALKRKLASCIVFLERKRLNGIRGKAA